jgi:NAD(P)H-dependent flavin oxidoreductase YrpB (nitropropane dioxygenase family)
MRTPLCDLLGIEHPIVQAPMGGPAVPRLAAAVSNAGALGMLVLGRSDDAGAPVGELRGLTQHPFAGNFVLREDQHARLEVALEAGLAIVSLFWGDPTPYVDQVHDAGALLVHTVGSAEEAKRVVAAGADVVVAQGWDAGGHVWGQVGTLALVPAVVDAVAPTPVIAAGGIGDGRGVAAVLALGAQGAWVGTRFLMAEEAPVHEHYRRRLIEAVETDALWFPDLFDGGWPDAPHRALRNATIDAWEAAGRPPAGSRPGEGEQVATSSTGAAIPRYASLTPLDGMDGDIDAMSLWAGQSVALARRVEPAADIVAELVSRL